MQTQRIFQKSKKGWQLLCHRELCLACRGPISQMIVTYDKMSCLLLLLGTLSDECLNFLMTLPQKNGRKKKEKRMALDLTEM